jgi:hypothetical protein
MSSSSRFLRSTTWDLNADEINYETYENLGYNYRTSLYDGDPCEVRTIGGYNVHTPLGLERSIVKLGIESRLQCTRVMNGIDSELKMSPELQRILTDIRSSTMNILILCKGHIRSEKIKAMAGLFGTYLKTQQFSEDDFKALAAKIKQVYEEWHEAMIVLEDTSDLSTQFDEDLKTTFHRLRKTTCSEFSTIIADLESIISRCCPLTQKNSSPEFHFGRMSECIFAWSRTVKNAFYALSCGGKNMDVNFPALKSFVDQLGAVDRSAEGGVHFGRWEMWEKAWNDNDTTQKLREELSSLQNDLSIFVQKTF